MGKKIYLPPKVKLHVVESEYSIAAASVNLDSTEGRMVQEWEEQEITFDLSDWGSEKKTTTR